MIGVPAEQPGHGRDVGLGPGRGATPGAAAAGRRRREWYRSLRRAVAARRRLLVAGLLAAATASALQATTDEVGGLAVTVTSRDLPAGHIVTDSDVHLTRWPVGTVPAGALPSPVGAVLAGPVRRGEPITDARLAGPDLMLGQPDDVRAVCVEVTPTSAALARPGHRIDVLAGPASSQVSEMARADVIVEQALVLAVRPPPGDVAAIDGSAGGEGFGTDPTGGGGLGGTTSMGGVGTAAVLTLAVDDDAAARLVAASGVRSLSVVVRAGR